MELLMDEKKLVILVHIEKKNQKVEDLIIKCDLKSCISFNPSCFIMPPSIPAYHLPNFQSTPSVQTSCTDYRPIDKKIDHLTEIMKGLALSV